MEVAPSRGAPRQLRHAALGLKDSINGGGQQIVDAFDQSDTVMMAVPAGSFSLHHTLCTHRSAPNRADHRRVGIGISYIPAHCRITSDVRMRVPLVRGTNTGGNFDILPPPSEGEFHPAAIARHEDAYRRYRDNYAAQIDAHDRAFAGAAAPAPTPRSTPRSRAATWSARSPATAGFRSSPSPSHRCAMGPSFSPLSRGEGITPARSLAPLAGRGLG